MGIFTSVGIEDSHETQRKDGQEAYIIVHLGDISLKVINDGQMTADGILPQIEELFGNKHADFIDWYCN